MDYTKLIPKLPTDEDGFIKSFDVLVNSDETKYEEKEVEANKQEIQNFFNEYGVVVVRNILNEQELSNSVNEVYDFVEENFKGYKRDDASTWNAIKGISAKLGIMTDFPIMSHQMCLNRVNKKLSVAYSYILDTPEAELMTNIGRVSYMRPTRNIRIKKEKIKDENEKENEKEKEKETEEESKNDEFEILDKPEWKTRDGKLWLHVDMDPLTDHCTTFGFIPRKLRKEANYKKDMIDDYGQTRVQGVLALNNVSINDGGFECVPGFHKIMKSVWIPTIGKDVIGEKIMGHRYQFSKDDPIIDYIQKCPLRQGSLLVWNSRLPHNNFPNDSGTPRLVQYIKYARRDDTSVKFVQLGVEQVGGWGMWPVTAEFPGNHQEWIKNNLDERGKIIYSIGMEDPEPEEEPTKKEQPNSKSSSKNSKSSNNCTLL